MSIHAGLICSCDRLSGREYCYLHQGVSARATEMGTPLLAGA